MKHALPIVALLALSACASIQKDALHTIGVLTIDEMAAQTALNTAKPHMAKADADKAQNALDAWLAGLDAADTARKAGKLAEQDAALASAAMAQSDALKIIPKGN